MNAEHASLASAYLDGELTDEERRIARADPAVMAAVQELRALRARIADVPPPTAAARDTALAAAMAAFQERATSAPPTHRSTRRPARWLAAAAAVVVFGALGVIVATRGGEDDQSTADPADARDDAVPGTGEVTADVMAEPAAEEPAAEEPAEEPAALTEAADVLAGAEEPASEERAEEEPAEAAAEEPAAEEPAMEPASDVDAASHLDGVPMTTPGQLSAVGRHLLDLIDGRRLPPTPEHSCPFSDVLAEGSYGEPSPVAVYVAVDTTSHRVLAIDTATCEVVVVAPLP